jgi:hypothetical protein
MQRPGERNTWGINQITVGKRPLIGFLFRHFSTLLSGFRQADRNRLLPAFYHSTVSAFARLEGTGFLPMHRALHALTCGAPYFAVYSSLLVYGGLPAAEPEAATNLKQQLDNSPAQRFR